MGTGAWIGICIGIGILLGFIGAFLGFLITKKMFEKQIRENPPITEKMIRVMFMQMGRKASEAQIKSVMRAMTNAKNSDN
ncbi:YneF family protein [Mycoplasmopsis lipophila]|uniref:YneF family protein n=1 Tax=Mycoplasmopsis lipophila TaxID=2117 RepID=UPI00387347F2